MDTWRDLFTHLGTPWLAFLRALRGRELPPDLQVCPKCRRTSQGAQNGLCHLCRHLSISGGHIHQPADRPKVVRFPALGGAKE